MQNERTVVLKDNLKPEEAVNALREAPTGFGGVKEAVPSYTKIKEYTTFEAEYTMIGEDVVVHFFPSEELKVAPKQSGETYWKVHFPEVLNETAQEYFNATAPRLVAKYTEELYSWWFKAQGYGHIIDLDFFIRRFFEKMDAKLEELFKLVSKS